MAEKDLYRHRLPPEYEDEVIALLETYGLPVDIGALAEMMGVNGKALSNFIHKSKRGKEALARAHPDAKKLLRPHIRLPSTTQDQALPEDASLDGMQIYASEIPEGLVSLLKTKKKRHAA